MTTSALIINWNTKEHLERCVRSFLAEGLPQKGIVVIDQDSTDGSAAMVRRRFPKVKIICTENVGYAHAANLGMKSLRTDIAVISNADITLDEGCLSTIEAEFQKDGRIGVIGCAVYDSDRRRVTRFSRTSVRRGIALELIPRALRGTWRSAEQHIYSRSTPFDVTFVEGAFMAVRREIYSELGGMDEGFSFFHEDADLPIRMLKSGFRVVHVPAAGVTHIAGASFSQVPVRQAPEFYRNMVRLYRRHALRRSLWLRRLLGFVLRIKNIFLSAVTYVASSSASRLDRNRAILESLNNHVNINRPEINPLVSVVIPTSGRPELVKKLVSSLQYQSYKNFEVVIIDQSDGKPMSVRPKTLKQPVTLHSLKLANRSIAKNVGVLNSEGSLLLFCDDDVIPDRNFIKTHVMSHRDTRIAGVSCRTVEDGLPDLKSKNICRVTWYGKMIDGFQSDVTCLTETLVGGNMSIKRTAMMEAGYFDSIYKGTSIFEEQDVSERLRSLGYHLFFTNASTVRHIPQEGGNVGIRTRQPSEYYHDFHHNEIVYFLKNRNHLLLPFVICFCFLRCVKQSIRYGLSFRQGLHMFMGVPEGFRSYYQSLK